MKRKIELGTAVFFMMVCAIISCLVTYTFLSSKITTSIAFAKKYDKLSSVEKQVNSKFIADVDADVAIDGMISGYIASIDKYGAYLDADEYQQFISQSKGKYVGLGITVRSYTGNIKIAKVQQGSPAELADVRPGDIIYKIGDTLVEQLAYSDATAMLQGHKGDSVILGLYRGEETLEKSLTYAEFTSTSVEYEIITGTSVGLIRMERFEENTFNDFKKAYEYLQSHGATKVIMDVRNNTGGELSSVCKILDYLLPEGNLVTVTDKSGGKAQTIKSDAKAAPLPMVVLINNESYSAAELFAAAIHDFEKGTLVGETTYGKGMAQSVIPLGDGTALYLSTQLYYTPKGENIDGVGVVPDVKVSLTDDQKARFYELSLQEDTQLQKALEIAKTK